MAKDNAQMLAKVTAANVQQQGAAAAPLPAKKKTLDTFFEAYRPKFGELLQGSGMSSERFVRILITEVATNDKLTAIAINNPKSLLSACMEMASLGLDPSIHNEGWLIPYGPEATFQPGYKGLSKLALDAARDYGNPLQLLAMNAIHTNDIYEREFGAHPVVTHKPPPFGQERGALIGFYAVSRDAGGRICHQEMTVAEVEAHQKQFCKGLKNPNSPFAGGKNFDSYGLKTVLRRLINRDLPMGPKLARALSIDKDAEPVMKISPSLFDESPELLPPPASGPEQASSASEATEPNAAIPQPVVEVVNEKTGEVTEQAVETQLSGPAPAAPAKSVSVGSAVAKGAAPGEIAAAMRAKAKKLQEDLEHGKKETDKDENAETEQHG